MRSDIRVHGAKENNLKNIDVTIPRDKLVVFTGLSGSGKSSLAFDTIFAEGQRRYIESLSSYARMFLGQMEKPDVESIDGLSPAISIDQKTTSKNPRSTVGTVTEIYDYLRLLFAHAGVPHCPKCGREITSVSVDQINERIMQSPEGTKVIISAPVVRGRKGEFNKLFEQYRKQVQLSRTSQEAVDFVIVMPGNSGEEQVYLPIDSKFPLDRYTQLVEISEEGNAESTEKARKALFDEVKKQAKSISSKYVKPPVTTNFAIMYLPTEGLYAEIVKDSAFTASLQNDCKVTVCGPTTITALLNSLQTGFTTLKIQKKSGEIVKELQRFRKDFERYTDLITKIKRNAKLVVDTVEDVEKRNEKIIGRLRKVGDELPAPVQEDNLIEQVASEEEI